MCSTAAWERAKIPATTSKEGEEILGMLDMHLRTSSLYDSKAVIAALSNADLFEELVIVHRKVHYIIQKRSVSIALCDAVCAPSRSRPATMP